MEAVAYAITGGWASGISAYATILLFGLFGRAELIEAPEALERTDVLVVMGVLTAVEFIADKVPFIDSLWDSVHTAIRPILAAVLGLLLAGDASTLGQALMAVLAGGLALATHAAKTGIRLAVNSSPEPVSNAAVSTGEDVSLAGVLLISVQYPWVAAGLALALLVVGIGLATWLFVRIRTGWRHVKDKFFADLGD